MCQRRWWVAGWCPRQAHTILSQRPEFSPSRLELRADREACHRLTRDRPPNSPIDLPERASSSRTSPRTGRTHIAQEDSGSVRS